MNSIITLLKIIGNRGDICRDHVRGHGFGLYPRITPLYDLFRGVFTATSSSRLAQSRDQCFSAD